MKNNLIYKSVLTLIIMLSFTFTSCVETETLDVGTSEIVEASGDWYIEFLVDGVDVFGIGYQLITTTNTANDSGTEFIIDDRSHTWQFKVTSPIDTTDLTFSGSQLFSRVDDYEVTVNINNGKITKDGAISTGGNTVDGIYFEAEFSDDPGTIYQLVGYKRTGLAEDEH